MPRYSQKPPTIAPTRLAPKKLPTSEACRRPAVKMIPAKKIGAGTAIRAHSNRAPKSRPRTQWCGTRVTASSVANKGDVPEQRRPGRRAHDIGEKDHEQDPRHDDRRHEPRRAEIERAIADALGFQEQEAQAQKEGMPAPGGQARRRRPAGREVSQTESRQ